MHNTESGEPSLASTDPAPSPPKEAPRPTFDALPLSAEARAAIDEMGYEHPTPVQLAVWEPATRGRDAVVQARTGTGKTASFGLPIIDHIVRRSEAAVQALVLCPTRELALQVSGEIGRLAAHKGTKILAIYGGAGMERQVQGIEEGAQVVVGTPGRVLDHIRRGTLPTRHIRLLVLDESDEMLSMGFERELTAILETLPPSRQTLLFSATVPPDIERIAKNRLKSPEFITLSGDHIGALEIDHFVYMVPGDKIGSLVRIIEVENPESAVVFCNTRDQTQAVAEALTTRGFDADWLNGDLPQGDREKVMAKTREGRLRFLVATDVAARGIDISHLTHVINYDFPQDAESYVHRTGRTGRAGRTGTAISLIAPRDIGGLYLLRLTYKIRPVERQIPTPGDLKTRAEADLVTMLAEAYLPRGGAEADRALARRLLSHDHAEGILAGLLREHLAARPNAQDEASQTRRTEPRRAPERAPRDEGRSKPKSAPRVHAILPTAHAVVPLPQAPIAEVGAPPVVAAAMEPFSPRADKPIAEEGDKGVHLPERRPRRPRDRDAARTLEPRRTSRNEGARPPKGELLAPPAAEFANWHPPTEEGDDEPLMTPRRAEAARAPTEVVPEARPPREPIPPDMAELFVSVGRRDGVRAQDILKVLVETVGLDPVTVQRIRVRDRHSFVHVNKGDVEAAVEKTKGVSLGGRALHVEIARERTE